MTASCSRLIQAVSSLALLAGCTRTPPPASTAAAEKPKAEAELARTTIARAAQVSLGIRTTPVRVEAVQERRQLPGWIVPRPGNEVVVTAPVAGYVRAPDPPAALPAPGLPVRQGQELFRLEPVLSPLEQTQLASLRRGIESDLAKARESTTVAENELKRVEALFKQNLRGERDVEQSRLLVKAAREDLAAAEDKLKVIAAPNAAKGDFQPLPLTLTAPRAGITVSVPANPGQFVAAAAPLTTIADLTTPWVRVPVPEFDLGRIDRRHPALVTMTSPADRQETPTVALPMGLVPQVDLQRHSADLMYELDPASPATGFAKDQMVLVAVPLGGRTDEAIVPYGAILFDGYGGTWLYLDRTPNAEAADCVYERVRVELGPPVGKDVAVRPALKAGDRVVSEGAAALFSREFYRPPVVVAGAKEKAK